MSRDPTPTASPAAVDPDRSRAPVDAPVGVGAPSPRHRRRRVAAAGLVALVVAAVVWGQVRDDRADVRDGTTAVGREEMAARTGVDVNLIAVTAAGGLIELRVQVTDPDKADDIVHEVDQRPVLVSEDSGETLIMAAPPHHRDELELGGEYFFLMANANNALRAGSRVTMVIGGSRLEHLEVVG